MFVKITDRMEDHLKRGSYKVWEIDFLNVGELC